MGIVQRVGAADDREERQSLHVAVGQKGCNMAVGLAVSDNIEGPTSKRALLVDVRSGLLSQDVRYSNSHGPTRPWQYQGVIMAEQGMCLGNHAGVIDYKGNSYFFSHNQGIAGGGQCDRLVCVEQFTYQLNNPFPTIKMTYTGAPQIGVLNPYQRIKAGVKAETMAGSYGVQTQPCS